MIQQLVAVSARYCVPVDMQERSEQMRLLVIAPNAMLTSLLTKVLDNEKGIEIVGATTVVAEAQSYADRTDIVALHADVAGSDLFNTIQTLRVQLPDAKVVLLHAPDLQDLIIGAIEVGAVGYVRSHETVSQMVATLRAVYQHGVSIEPEFTSVLIERMARLSRQVRSQSELKFNLEAELTDRQMEVLGLVHKGLSNDEISQQLYISIGTVKNHVHNILQTLEADNREQAAYWYSLQEAADVSGIEFEQGIIDSRSVIAESLKRFSTRLGWSIGHAFLVDQAREQLVPTDIWHLDSPTSYKEFRQETAKLKLGPRQDIIGNILFSPEPIWVADVASYPGYLRAESARQAGIQSGLILPIGQRKVIGVLEFYATVRSRPDPQTVADIVVSSRDLSDHIESQVDDKTPGAS